MPLFGGYTPFPWRFGSGAPPGATTNAPLLQRVFQSIAAQRGSAYDQTPNSTVGIENMAIARAITFDGYGQNQKMSNEMLPSKCTATKLPNGSSGLLPRWENIFGTPPNIGDTETVRRARVSAAWLRLTLGNAVQAITDLLTAALNTPQGTLFLGLQFGKPATAVSYWPGGTTLVGFPWYSTLCQINAQLQIPANYANADGTPNALWWAAVGAVQMLDGIVPAWVTFQWYVNDPQNPSLTGWILDTNELDLEIFDS